MIEIYLLEQLTAFRQYGTLSEAAKHLHISQPALSRSMQKLEEVLDVKLFERSKNRIGLSAAGLLAADLASRILQSEDEMITAVRNYDRSLNTISVGYCAPGPMMAFSPQITSRFSGMMISSEMDEEEALVHGLISRKYQMIILSYRPEQENFLSIPCGTESLFLSVIPAHPAAVYEKTGVSFHDMNGETFLMAADVGIWEKIKAEKMPDSRLIRQKDLDLLKEVVNSSSLAAFATDISLRLNGPDYRAGRIMIPFTDPEATVHYYCVCLKENEDRLNDWFTYLRNQMPQ